MGDPTSDLVERLRKSDGILRTRLEREAADEIEQLRAANAELVEAAQPFLPILPRQLNGLLEAAEVQDGAKSLFESVAWKTATERVERLRAALARTS